jgi:hypothetical protein
MRIFPADEKRLALLNEAQPGRPWQTCSERRRCIGCESVFDGREVTVNWSRHRITRLGCPLCGSTPALWVRLGNPLIDEQAWADWEAAMEFVASDLHSELASVR